MVNVDEYVRVILRPPVPETTHYYAHFKCTECHKQWAKDAWAKHPISEESQEVEHFLETSCRGRVVKTHEHHHVDHPYRCRCMRLPEPT